MQKLQTLLALSMIAGLVVPAFAAGDGAARKHRIRSSAKHTTRHVAKTKFEPKQRSIDDERAAEIQQALIKAGYLTGSPSGHWDQQSISAMTKLQAANGWQTKLVPDSRALIKLGLGPSFAPASPDASPTQTAAYGGSSASIAYAR